MITLGIIGIVAAMTLPGLITKWRNEADVAQLKKGVNIMENGFRKMMADDGVTTMMDTDLAKSYEWSTADELYAGQKKRKEILAKTFKAVSITEREFPYGYVTLKGQNDFTAHGASTNNVVTLADGSAFRLFRFSRSNYQPNTISEIEFFLPRKVKCNYTNGNLKRCVQWDRTAFIFYLMDDGSLAPYGSKKIDKVWGYPREENYCGGAKSPLAVRQIFNGACASRIIYNNWKMDY